MQPEIVTITIEELIGLAGLSTFLIGFTSVRLSGSIDAARARADLLMSRISDDAKQSDLLPLPTDMSRLAKGAVQGLARVYLIAAATVFVAVATLSLSTFLAWPILAGEDLVRSAIVTQVIHGAVIMVGCLDALIQSRELYSLSRGSVTSEYLRLEAVLRKLLTADSTEKEELVAEARTLCREINGVVPDWCWITLIQADLEIISPTPATQDELFKILRPALLRIRDLAAPTRNGDTYSLAAWIWAVWLISRGNDLGQVTDSELQRARRERSLGTLNEFAVRRYDLDGFDV